MKDNKKLQDILAAIEAIETYSVSSQDEFLSDSKTQDAILYNLIIIGEAANQIPEEVEEKYPAIPWHLMRAMRNRIVHAYFEVDEKLMWDTVKNDLPPLIPELEKLL